MENNNFNNEYNYNPYTNPQQNDNQKKTPSRFAGFGVTLVKTAAIALVFGLVAGGAGAAVLKLSDVNVGFIQDTEDDSESGGKSGDGFIIGIPNTPTATQVSVAVMDVSDIVEGVMPSVVAITNTTEVEYKNPWGQPLTQKSQSVGTGFIVSKDKEYIYIASNNHVVEGATQLTVQFANGATVEAEIKGTVPSKDLAVVKVAMRDIGKETLSIIRVATLGDSNKLEVGEGAIAIGNALGYGQSVTTGVISALGRSVTVRDSLTGTQIVNNNLIQTDAAINPGNSGGALLNVKGEVIGINSVKYADTNVEGIGYAIPISDAMLIIEKLIEGEKIDAENSGYLGIQGQTCELGAYVHSVFEGSAAEAAGIRPGDIIIGFEGNSISTMNHLVELLSYYPAGEEVELVLLRPKNKDYVELTVTVILGDASTISLE